MKEVTNTSSLRNSLQWNTAAKKDIPANESADVEVYDIVVFSHLRWEFVYQRPQHIISRLAKNFRILFVEEPLPYKVWEKDSARITVADENITILQPLVDKIDDIGELLAKYLSTKKVRFGWFYSAAFSPILNVLKFDKVVYDCIDELTLFKGASPQLIDQEKYLLSEADLVFTGGKSLYEAKNTVHHNVHCFPSSVDRRHFEQALNGIPVPEDMRGLKTPIIGYYGVIDERIDLELIEQVARANPEASFVMVGPIAKIADEDLPKLPNLYYPGMRSYKMLPHYLKSFDIAMMPFALNDSTRFISPTKTLEFMAAGKPIISTPIADVVRDYKDYIHIVSTADEFSKAINSIMSKRWLREVNTYYQTILEKTSWDNTVQHMQKLITAE